MDFLVGASTPGKIYAGCGHGLVKLISLLTAITVIIVAATSFKAFTVLNRTPSDEYGLLVDAGSHGTRIHLFTWKDRYEDPQRPLRGPVSLPVHLWQHSASQGLSSKIYDPENAARDCIAPLLLEAKKELQRRNVPESVWPNAPLFIKATAGLRDVGVGSRSAVMWNIRDYLTLPDNNPFQFKPDWCRVTAGEEEGVYGWLTVNSVMGTWKNTANQTVGSLDMGGASTQITFFPIHTSVLEDFYALFLGDKQLRLYSHSYLGFGWGDALMRLTTRLGVQAVIAHVDEFVTPKNTSSSVATPNNLHKVAAPLSSTNATKVILDVIHPCFPKGHEVSVEMPSLVYPDGRYYIDLNYHHIVEYMKAIGLPEEDVNDIVKQTFFDRNSIKDDDKEEIVIRQSRELQDAKLARTSDVLLMRRRDNARAARSSMERILVDDDDDETYQDDESEQTKSTYHGNSQTLKNDLKQREHEFTRFQAKNKQNKNRKNFADVVFQDSDSLYKGHSMGPFKALNHNMLNGATHWFTIRYHGGSDFEQCQLRAQDLFLRAPCFVHSCSFEGVYEPRLSTSKFVAFGQYSKVQTALNISNEPTLNEMETAVKNFCGLSKKEIREGWNKGLYRPYGQNGVMKLCWKATWAHTFLTRGLQFPNNSTQINFAATIGVGDEAQSPGWALGSMIYEINFFSWKSPSGKFEFPLIAAVVTILLLLFLVLILSAHVEWLRELVSDSEGYVHIAP